MTTLETGPLVSLRAVDVRIGATTALTPVDLDVRSGEVLVVAGRSGSGKSTLLAVLAGWLAPSGGEVGVGEPLARERRRWHRTATVPQSLALLEELSLAENIALPAVLLDLTWRDARRLAAERLDALGLEGLDERLPGEVSVGQQQRAAVARALVLEPALVLADEPTAHLDTTSTGLVIDELRRSAASGSAVVVATHDPLVMQAADRVVELRR